MDEKKSANCFEEDMVAAVKARALHDKAHVVLGYVNPAFTYARGRVSAAVNFDPPAGSESWMQANIPLLIKGGVNIVIFSLGVNEPHLFPGLAAVEYMLRCFEALITAVERDERTMLIRSKRDLDQALESGKLGIILHMTGAPINGDLAVLRAYYHLGLRAAHIFINDDSIGGSDSSSPGYGLKKAGRELIEEMESLGMLLDVAHTNDRTFAGVLSGASRTVIDSHTCCRSLRGNFMRNITDRQMRAIAETGGAIGVHFASTFICDGIRHALLYDEADRRNFSSKIALMEKKYRDPYEFLAHRYDPYEWPQALGGAVDDGTRIERARLEWLAEHIDRMVRVAGIDHVAIGADYSLSNVCAGVESCDKLPNLTAELLKRGYKEAEASRIIGGNWIRIYRDFLPD